MERKILVKTHTASTEPYYYNTAYKLVKILIQQMSQEVHTRLSKLALPAIQCRSRSLEPLQHCQQVGFKFFCRLNTSSYHRENSLYNSR